MKSAPTDGPARPLTPGELTSWLTYDWPKPIIEYTARIPIFTGLYQHTLGHVQPDWISTRDGLLTIEVPPKSPCPRTDGDGVCTYCRNYTDGLFRPKKSNPRLIFVIDDRSEVILENIFSLRNITYSTVLNAWTNVKNYHPLDREVDYHALRHSYGTILAAKGFDLEEIARQMGYDIDVPTPLRVRRPRDYEWLANQPQYEELGDTEQLV